MFDLLVGPVGAKGGAAVSVAINGGVELVGDVARVRASSVGRRTGAGSQVAAGVVANSPGVVPIAIDSRVGCVCQTGAVRAVNTLSGARGVGAEAGGAGAVCVVADA